jgi:tetratricopeptide (TPR) repeat protein
MKFIILIGMLLFLYSCKNNKESKVITKEIKEKLIGFKQSGDYKSAIDLLTKEISSNPNSAWYFNERGYCYKVLYEKDTNQKVFIQNALSDFTKAISIEPNQERYISRAEVYTSLKRKKEALDDYNFAVNNKTGNRAVSLRERGSFYFWVMKDSLKAFSDFRSAIKEFPDSSFLYLRYAQHLSSANRLDEAINYFLDLTTDRKGMGFKVSRMQRNAAEIGLIQTLVKKEDYLGALISSNNSFGWAAQSLNIYVKYKLGQQDFAKREMKKLGDKLKEIGANRDKYYFELFPNEPKSPTEIDQIKRSELTWPDDWARYNGF